MARCVEQKIRYPRVRDKTLLSLLSFHQKCVFLFSITFFRILPVLYIRGEFFYVTINIPKTYPKTFQYYDFSNFDDFKDIEYNFTLCSFKERRKKKLA